MPIDFANTLRSVSKVKLRGGVVGKVSTVLIVFCICVAGLAVFSKNETVLGISIAGIIIVVFTMLWRLINFADKNPQAAILEGAEFLLHQQMLMGSKHTPVIEADNNESFAERPITCSRDAMSFLSQPDQTPAQKISDSNPH
ncbi:MAG: hypothetical protein WCO56_29630 [Verrucomicrobiota bacterium]